jgi:feruloyl esterase
MQARGAKGQMDAKHDVLQAMMAWVENKTAPNEIIATAWDNGASPSKVYRQRPLCVYPKQAKYKGTGDEKQAENWVCADLY